MKKILFPGFFAIWMLSTGTFLQAQEFNELTLERISPADSAGIYNISGWITDHDRANKIYYLCLRDRYGNLYLQKPSCSIMRDSVFNHYNIVIVPYNNKEIVVLRLFSIESSDKKALRKIEKIGAAGIPEHLFRARYPEFHFLPKEKEIKQFR